MHLVCTQNLKKHKSQARVVVDFLHEYCGWWKGRSRQSAERGPGASKSGRPWRCLNKFPPVREVEFLITHKFCRLRSAVIMDKARAKFLAHASQQLFTASPTTSAHLSFQHFELQQVAKDCREGVEACRGCGSLSVPGVTSCQSRASLRNNRNSKHPVPSKRDMQGTLTSRCLACGRDTKHRYTKSSKPTDIRSGSKYAISKPATLTSVTTTQEYQPQPSMTQEPKLSSKKRAQARKKRAGLQALLDKSKSTDAPSKFSFTDLMKK